MDVPVTISHQETCQGQGALDAPIGCVPQAMHTP